MVVSYDSVTSKIEDFYREHYPELIITRRIKDKLFPIITGGLEKADEPIPPSKADEAIADFLSREKIIAFIMSRQPNVAAVPDDVVESIQDYFKGELKSFKVLSVYRKSNHPEDELLYMVKARCVNGEYACWTSWNQALETLNHGHYNLPSDEACMKILKEQFNDISSEPEKYGMEVSKHSLIEEGEHQENDKGATVIPIHRRKAGGR